ncbi:hypothetical protein NQ176_g10624 [Zarea fungicola]|uniref:Uncharacterized protein n=1 Tax=Zarea fungicola TaxID=93591 RepID=A0ACC1MFW8_9HYPO|nr:hypothetical protein NQ176_g10624 [Lecanicillium fungicola]
MAYRASQDKEPSTAEISKWYKDILGMIVNERLERESSLKSVQPVFLSHYIENGVFRHWVLHVHGHKYELRRAPPKHPASHEKTGFLKGIKSLWPRLANHTERLIKADVEAAAEPTDKPLTQITGETETGRSTSLLAAAKYYHAHIGDSKFDMETYKKSVIAKYTPQIGHYFYSMIGWTSLSQAEVDHECNETYARFGHYTVLSNNCHTFLQMLAHKIITTTAPDWYWFHSSPLRDYRYAYEPPRDSQLIHAAVAIKRISRLRHHLNPDARREVDVFIKVLENFVQAGLQNHARTEPMQEPLEGPLQQLMEEPSQHITEGDTEDTEYIMEYIMEDIMEEGEEVVVDASVDNI